MPTGHIVMISNRNRTTGIIVSHSGALILHNKVIEGRNITSTTPGHKIMAGGHSTIGVEFFFIYPGTAES